MRVFANANRNWSPLRQLHQPFCCFARKSTANPVQKKRRPKLRTPLLANAILCPLEREINPSANHAKVVLRSVHKVPTEIADPANVRGEPNFHAAADLADCPGLGTGLFSANDSVIHNNIRLFAATKDSAAPTENVRRETRAGNRVA